MKALASDAESLGAAISASAPNDDVMATLEALLGCGHDGEYEIFLTAFRASVGQKDYALSRQICALYLDRHGRDRSFLKWSVDIFYRTGDWAGCLEHARELVDTFGDEDSSATLASYLWRLNRPEEAVRLLSPTVFSAAPNTVSGKTYNTLMEASLRLGGLDEIGRLLERLASLDLSSHKVDHELYLACAAAMERWDLFDGPFARRAAASPHKMSRRHLSLALSRHVRSRPNNSARRSVSSLLSDSLTVFQYWNDLTHLKGDVLAAIEGWRRTMSGRHVLFDQDMAVSFLARYFGSVAVDAFESSTHPAQEADLIRLAWLYIKGGIYVDADTLPNERILQAEITKGKYIALWHRDNLPPQVREVVNSFMIASPRQDFILRMFEQACHNIRSKRRGIWHDTGPGLLSAMVLETGGEGPYDLISTRDVLETCLRQDGTWSYKSSAGGKWQDA